MKVKLSIHLEMCSINLHSRRNIMSIKFKNLNTSILILMVCCLFVLSACHKSPSLKETLSSTTSAAIDFQPLIDIATPYTLDLLEGNYQSAYNTYAHDSKMKEAVNEIAYEDIMKGLTKQVGAFKSILSTDTKTSGAYQIVSINTDFEGGTISINVVFNSAQKISGLNFTPYTNASTTSSSISTSSAATTTTADFQITSGTFGETDYPLTYTLTTPKDEKIGTGPIVILVQGSGASDQDESIGPNKPFSDIAAALAKDGISTFRYPKRTFVYGTVFASNKEATIYDETINDVVLAYNLLTEKLGYSSKNVFVLGHSLGGHVMPLIATKLPNAGGFIFMAGNARSLQEILPEQYTYLFNLDGTLSKEEKTAQEDLSKQLKILSDLPNVPDGQAILGAYKKYWEVLTTYKPLEEVLTVKQPMLFLQGERDYQVTMTDFNLWKNTLANNKKATFITYPLLNHLMMQGNGKSTPDEYGVPGTVSEALTTDIANWIAPLVQ